MHPGTSRSCVTSPVESCNDEPGNAIRVCTENLEAWGKRQTVIISERICRQEHGSEDFITDIWVISLNVVYTRRLLLHEIS